MWSLLTRESLECLQYLHEGVFKLFQCISAGMQCNFEQICTGLDEVKVFNWGQSIKCLLGNLNRDFDLSVHKEQ